MTPAGNSPSRIIYNNAIQRLTSWRHSHIVEIVLWSIFAAIAGLLTTDMLSNGIAIQWIIKPFYWILVMGTPLIIFWAVSRIQMTGTDEVLRTVPLKPYQIVLPSIGAIVATYLRYMLPVILALAVTYEATYAHDFPGFFERLLRTASGSLIRFPNHYPMLLESETSWRFDEQGNLMTSRLLLLNDMGHSIIIAFAVLQWLGWLMLPITWGLYWRTRLRGSNSSIAYFAYLVPAIAMISANYFRAKASQPRGVYPFYESTLELAGLELDTGWTFEWIWMSVWGLSGFLLAVYMCFLTLRIWGKPEE